MNHITIDELIQRRNQRAGMQLIDVRSPQEYRAGHLPGALNIPMETIGARLGDLNAEQEIVLICQSGKRAIMVYQHLRGTPHSLAVLAGGTAGWQAAGLPVIAEQSSDWSLDRQVRLAAGLLVLLGILGSFGWRPGLGLAIFVGGGLTFSGLSGWCGMGLLLAKMPWNRTGLPVIAVSQNKAKKTGAAQ